MGNIGVGPEELHSAASTVRSVAVTGTETCITNVRNAISALDDSLQGALRASQTALSQWSAGQGMVAFEEASSGVQKDFNQINQAISGPVMTSLNQLQALLNRLAQALDEAGNGYTSTDQAIMSQFQSMAGG